MFAGIPASSWSSYISSSCDSANCCHWEPKLKIFTHKKTCAKMYLFSCSLTPRKKLSGYTILKFPPAYSAKINWGEMIRNDVGLNLSSLIAMSTICCYGSVSVRKVCRRLTDMQLNLIATQFATIVFQCFSEKWTIFLLTKTGILWKCIRLFEEIILIRLMLFRSFQSSDACIS